MNNTQSATDDPKPTSHTKVKARHDFEASLSGLTLHCRSHGAPQHSIHPSWQWLDPNPKNRHNTTQHPSDTILLLHKAEYHFQEQSSSIVTRELKPDNVFNDSGYDTTICPAEEHEARSTASHLLDLNRNHQIYNITQDLQPPHEINDLDNYLAITVLDGPQLATVIIRVIPPVAKDPMRRASRRQVRGSEGAGTIRDMITEKAERYPNVCKYRVDTRWGTECTSPSEDGRIRVIGWNPQMINHPSSGTGWDQPGDQCKTGTRLGA
ncbi:hypothetical protein BKA62DRAFT_676466 [Auriculariales sp. MPI-PUGE-AT-0066]|nr:hypothetical protein BKA62DRAFT_676466 [Auriculariales sp. MPI-PUGE-AT-0066]